VRKVGSVAEHGVDARHSRTQHLRVSYPSLSDTLCMHGVAYREGWRVRTSRKRYVVLPATALYLRSA
jgi:hypothetical protein